jgi:hypothetical protein
MGVYKWLMEKEFTMTVNNTNTTSATVFNSMAQRAIDSGKMVFHCSWGSVRLTEDQLVQYSKDQYLLRREVWVCTPMSDWSLVYSGTSAGACTAFGQHVSAMMQGQKPLCGEYKFW